MMLQSLILMGIFPGKTHRLNLLYRAPKYCCWPSQHFQRRINLSRARGSKAQQKRQQQNQHSTVENTISFEKGRRLSSRTVELVPKTLNQERLILALNDANQHIVISVGPAGTGKSYLAMIAAIRALRRGDCERIVLTRPAVGVDDERHGFLPGDLNSKMEPWTRPLLDILREFYHPRDIAQMIEDQTIEISPLAFMRGRTFKNAWIVADEMQNATPGQMKMLLTRIGESSRIVVTGDVEQTDRQSHDNGLLDIAQRLEANNTDGIRICYLGNRDVQRHPIITQVLDLYQD
jgi:phosphate starvation-inducible protein PhoH and related proteins